MFTLIQSADVKGSAGEPLPKPWQNLETTFYRGQLVLVAAGPGTGKSAFVLNYALKTKASCLYFSADSDAFVQLTRSLSILSGCTLADSATVVMNNNTETLQELLSDVPIRFSYDSAPTLTHVEQQMLAYEELHGDFPELVVIDNALDVQAGGEESQAESLDGLMAWLHDLARQTGACVMVLHHVTGPYNDAATPIPLSGVKGQVGRVPEVILTLHKPDPQQLNVSTVKNRGGKADPSGCTYAELLFDGDRMNIADLQPAMIPEYDPQQREWVEQQAWQ